MPDNTSDLVKAMSLYQGRFLWDGQPVLQAASVRSSWNRFESVDLLPVSRAVLIDNGCWICVYAEQPDPDSADKLGQMTALIQQEATPDWQDYGDFAYIGPVYDGLDNILRRFCENGAEALVLCPAGNPGQNPDETILAPRM